MIDGLAVVHPLAHVDGSANIGARAKVWQFASVIRGAKLGDDCNVASCAIIDAAQLGDRCVVGHGASIHPGTLVGSDVFIGPAATCCNDRWPRCDKNGFDLDLLMDGDLITIAIEDGASIGAGAVILPGVVIGARSMIAAGAVVDRNVPAKHLFTRKGEIVPIDPARIGPRARQAAA